MSLFIDTRNKLTAWLAKDGPPRNQYLSNFDLLKEKIQICDVILIEGRNRISRVIKALTKSPWSHAALYIGYLKDIEEPSLKTQIKNFMENPDSDKQLVIEALLGRGVVVTELEFYHQDHLRICRPNGLTEHDSQQVIAYAIGKLGNSYNTRHVFDLLRFLLPIKILPRKWRSSLFRYKPGTVTEEMCSSIIAHAFESVNFPILPLIKKDRNDHFTFIRRNPLLYTPSDFDYSPFFNIIKYPLYDMYQQNIYQNLPWKDGVISNDIELVRVKKTKN